MSLLTLISSDPEYCRDLLCGFLTFSLHSACPSHSFWPHLWFCLLFVQTPFWDWCWLWHAWFIIINLEAQIILLSCLGLCRSPSLLSHKLHLELPIPPYLHTYLYTIFFFTGNNDVPTMTLTSMMGTCNKENCSPTIPASNTGL